MLASVAQFFNLSLLVSGTSGDGSDLCFIDGMTAKHKIMANLMAVHAVALYGSGVVNLLCLGSKKLNMWKLYNFCVSALCR